MTSAPQAPEFHLQPTLWDSDVDTLRGHYSARHSVWIDTKYFNQRQAAVFFECSHCPACEGTLPHLLGGEPLPAPVWLLGFLIQQKAQVPGCFPGPWTHLPWIKCGGAVGRPLRWDFPWLDMTKTCIWKEEENIRNLQWLSNSNVNLPGFLLSSCHVLTDLFMYS